MREAVAPETQAPALASAFGLWCFLDISAHVVIIVDVDVDQRPSPTHNVDPGAIGPYETSVHTYPIGYLDRLANCAGGGRGDGRAKPSLIICTGSLRLHYSYASVIVE